MDKPRRPLAAVVFDFDGVIADTEPLHCKAFNQVLTPLGLPVTWEEYRRDYMGFDDRDAFRAMHRNAGRALEEERLPVLIEAKALAFQRLAEREGAELYPGVERLIRGLSGRVPLGLCSGALRRDIEPILARHGLADAFDAMVTADEVDASKPDPLSYIMVLRRLAARYPGRPFTPGCCVAIEDTPAGLAAARGAGLRVLAVPTTYPAEALDRAHGVAPSLERVTAGDLERWINGERVGVVF